MISYAQVVDARGLLDNKRKVHKFRKDGDDIIDPLLFKDSVWKTDDTVSTWYADRTVGEFTARWRKRQYSKFYPASIPLSYSCV